MRQERPAAVLGPPAAGLAASSSPAIAWGPRDLSALALQDSCRQLRVDFAQAEEIGPPMLVQALVSKQKRCMVFS